MKLTNKEKNMITKIICYLDEWCKHDKVINKNHIKLLEKILNES